MTDIMASILLILGAGSAEEVPEGEIERFEQLSRCPIEINTASRSRLLSSGLFSEYQVAALEDYRDRTGDILSLSELSLVDGIGPDLANALAPFISFASSLAPGQRRSRRIKQSLMLRASVRDKGSGEWAEGCKYQLAAGSSAELYWSFRNGYSASSALPGTLSLALYSRRGSRVIAGDFAARFGQGLLLWSGMSLSGFASAESFRRNASGFAPTGSFSSVFRGVAADFPMGRWSLGGALFMEQSGKGSPVAAAPLFYALRMGRKGSFSLQAVKDGASLSGVLGLGHWTLFGETALSSVICEREGALVRKTRLAALCGTTWAPSYQMLFAALARYYPADYHAPYAGAARSASRVSDEAGLSLGARWHWAEMTLDCSAHPEKKAAHLKGILSLSPGFEFPKTQVATKLRLTERLRPQDRIPWRHELRVDVRASVKPSCSDEIIAAARVNVVLCRDFGALAYAEAGHASEGRIKLSEHLRFTVFRADSWDDRLYCYERDLPGVFSVPAYYKRGWAVSAVAGLRCRQRHSFFIKGSFLRYSAAVKPSVAEIKLQYQFKL